MKDQWNATDVPDQSGRVAVITGGGAGLGYELALVLAGRGAHVVLAVRDTTRGKDASERITAAHPHAQVTVQELDLASQQSVKDAAAAIISTHPHIDLLINNAGVMFPPKTVTEDGFELQFATNHLGHFALTGLLLGQMLPVAGSRVVTVSSLAHKVRAAINFQDLQSENKYSPSAAYAQSKLANLLFTYELNNRLTAQSNSTTIAVAAHPGGANTNLTRHTPSKLRWAQSLAAKVLFQSAAMGALPTLRAATDPAVKGGQYYGPGGFMEQRGHPVVVGSSAKSHEEGLRRQLWEVSEDLTAVSYPV
jgi:NAD(P)-dependent dehydrogenase (short-subunit alcohol dehydrogenase family)